MNFDEKREYFRMNVNCEIDYRVLESDDICKGRCATLSGGGISFVTGLELTLGMELEITIQPLHPLTPPMHANAKVIRVQPSDSQSYEIGATMIVLDEI